MPIFDTLNPTLRIWNEKNLGLFLKTTKKKTTSRGEDQLYTHITTSSRSFSLLPLFKECLLCTTLGSQSAEKGRRRHGIDGKKKKKTKKTNLFFDEEDDEEKDHHHQKEEGSSSWASRGHNKRSPGVASLLSRRFCGLRLLGGLCGRDETRR